MTEQKRCNHRIEPTTDRVANRKFVSRGGKSREGFTLLEIVLTLAMSVILMALVNAAFRYYAVDMDVANTDMRQTMLAAAVVQMIEDDLRATLHPEPMDTSALGELLSSTAAVASGLPVEEGVPEGGDLSAAGIESEEDAEVEEIVAEPVTLTSGAAILESPGLIGNQFQIQLDTSRLPRLEEYIALIDANNADLQDVLSDLKTVTYFVQAHGTLGGVVDKINEIDPAASEGSGGLIRRSLDRAATVYATENGNFTQLNLTGELIAPEVMSIEFSYWDGITWLLEWNSDEMGELPLAIQVRITMIDPNALAAGVDPASISPANAEEARVFQHIIRLPMAKPIEEEEDDLATEVEGT